MLWHPCVRPWRVGGPRRAGLAWCKDPSGGGRWARPAAFHFLHRVWGGDCSCPTAPALQGGPSPPPARFAARARRHFSSPPAAARRLEPQTTDSHG